MPKKSSPSSETLYQLYEQVKLVADILCQSGKDITTMYPDWRDNGFALADGLGEQGRPIFHQISSLYHNYKYGEADKQFDHCLRVPPAGRKITIATFFQKAKEAGIDISAAYRDAHTQMQDNVAEKPLNDDAPKEKVAKKRGRPKKTEKEKVEFIKQAEAEILLKYMLRRNLLSNQIECKKIDEEVYSNLDDKSFNSIWRDLRHNGTKLNQAELHSIVNSDFTPDFDPVKSYLDSLSEWDGKKDHIRELADMVKCINMTADEFYQLLKKWLVGLVTGYLNADKINETILCLIGRQGTYKTTFFRYLLPPFLRKYYYEEKNIDVIDKDFELRLARNLIINFDDMKALGSHNLNKMKSMVTQKTVDVRAPYDRFPKQMPRHASLVATGNEAEFLIDHTGNRRWIVAEVEKIVNPHEVEINYEGLYAQVYSLVKSGFQTWFDEEEIESINKLNERFQKIDETYEYIHTHYRKPREFETPMRLTASDIAAKIPVQLKSNPTKVGQAMAKLGYERQRSNKCRFYYVVELSANELGKVLVDDDEPQEDKPF